MGVNLLLFIGNKMIDYKKVLTKRHEQILKHIARGGSSKSFAEKHKLSLKTVDAHRWSMMKEIDCHNVAEVTMYAIKYDFIQLGETP